MSNLSLLTNIRDAMNSIDDGGSPVVDPNDGKIYVLDTSDRYIGNILYTIFDKETEEALSSWQARYGTYHTVQQVLFNPIPRGQLTDVLITEIPVEFVPDMTPGMIAGSYVVHSTKVSNT